jgi:hypothetical protein
MSCAQLVHQAPELLRVQTPDVQSGIPLHRDEPAEHSFLQHFLLPHNRFLPLLHNSSKSVAAAGVTPKMRDRKHIAGDTYTTNARTCAASPQSPAAVVCLLH